MFCEDTCSGFRVTRTSDAHLQIYRFALSWTITVYDDNLPSLMFVVAADWSILFP